MKKFFRYFIFLVEFFMFYVSLTPGFLFIFPFLMVAILLVSLPYMIYLLRCKEKLKLRLIDYFIIIFPHLTIVSILVTISGWIPLESYTNPIYNFIAWPLSWVFVPLIGG